MSKKKKVKALLRELEDMTAGDGTLHSDVQGSWTGNPLDGEQPVQDADDL